MVAQINQYISIPNFYTQNNCTLSFVFSDPPPLRGNNRPPPFLFVRKNQDTLSFQNHFGNLVKSIDSSSVALCRLSPPSSLLSSLSPLSFSSLSLTSGSPRGYPPATLLCPRPFQTGCQCVWTNWAGNSFLFCQVRYPLPSGEPSLLELKGFFHHTRLDY